MIARPDTKCVRARIVDTDTAEILMDKTTKRCFFCNADGEVYLKRLVQSLENGLRQGKNLSLTIDVFPFINDVEADLFGLDIRNYPCAFNQG